MTGEMFETKRTSLLLYGHPEEWDARSPIHIQAGCPSCPVQGLAPHSKAKALCEVNFCGILFAGEPAVGQRF